MFHPKLDRTICSKIEHRFNTLNDLLMSKAFVTRFDSSSKHWEYDEEIFGDLVIDLLRLYDMKLFIINYYHSMTEIDNIQHTLIRIFNDINENYPFVFNKLQKIKEKNALEFQEIEKIVNLERITQEYFVFLKEAV